MVDSHGGTKGGLTNYNPTHEGDNDSENDDDDSDEDHHMQ